MKKLTKNISKRKRSQDGKDRLGSLYKKALVAEGKLSQGGEKEACDGDIKDGLKRRKET